MKKITLLAAVLTTVIVLQAQKVESYEKKEYRDKRTAERLTLSEEQRQKAKIMNEEFRKKMDELRKKDDITVREWRNQMMDLNRKHREDVRGLLSNEQRAQIEKMRTERRKIAEIDANARIEKMKLRLDLNDQQVDRLKKQRMEMIEKMKSLRENQSMDMMKKREEMKALMDQRKQDMKSILTEEQMKKMQEIRKQAPRKRRVLS